MDTRLYTFSNFFIIRNPLKDTAKSVEIITCQNNTVKLPSESNKHLILEDHGKPYISMRVHRRASIQCSISMRVHMRALIQCSISMRVYRRASIQCSISMRVHRRASTHSPSQWGYTGGPRPVLHLNEGTQESLDPFFLDLDPAPR